MISTPAIIGTVMRPACSGASPSTIWKYVGRYDMVPIMPSMMNIPVTVHTTKLRFLNSSMGMMGSFALRSTSTNATAATKNSANSANICGEIHGNSVPPHAVASTSDDTDTAMAIMPPMSIGGRSSRRTGFVRKNATAAMASSASGMLNANSQRHPVTCTNQPPNSGPTTVDTANTEPMRPMYFPR